MGLGSKETSVYFRIYQRLSLGTLISKLLAFLLSFRLTSPSTSFFSALSLSLFRALTSNFLCLIFFLWSEHVVNMVLFCGEDFIWVCIKCQNIYGFLFFWLNSCLMPDLIGFTMWVFRFDGPLYLKFKTFLNGFWILVVVLGVRGGVLHLSGIFWWKGVLQIMWFPGKNFCSDIVLIAGLVSDLNYS